MNQMLAAMVLTAMNIKQFDLYKGKEGKFIKGFLLNDQRNKNGWRTTWQAILQDHLDFLNKPGTYLKKLNVPEHPDGTKYKEMMVNQEKVRAVNIIDLELDHATHTLNYVGEILPEELSEIDFEGLIDRGEINYTSPGIYPMQVETVGTMPNGLPMIDVSRFRALHIAYINDPAYGKDATKTVATCEGMGESCMTRLAANTESDLSHLQEVPLIKQTLNTVYTPCQIKDFHKTIAASESSCVSKKLRIIMDENPDMAKDQQLAIAYSYCSKEGRAKLAQDLSEKKQVKIVNAALIAVSFQPTQGEEPDKNGLYWRTIYGRKIPFKKGEDTREKVSEARKEAESKEKPKGNAMSKLPKEIKKQLATPQSAYEHLEDIAGNIDLFNASREAGKGMDRSEYAKMNEYLGNNLNKLSEADQSKLPESQQKLYKLASKQQTITDDIYQARLEGADKVLRGTDIGELETMLATGKTGQGGDFNYSCVSINEVVADKYHKGVIIEYSKESLGANMVSQGYKVLGSKHAEDTDDINVQPDALLMWAEEHRIKKGTPVKDLKMKIRIIGVPEADRAKFKKYEKLGEVVFQ